MYGKLDKDSSLYQTYEIESKLGSGGCGAVYKAWHKRLRKHIVLKELKDSSQKTLEACRNEIEALKNIKSMYVPQVFDFLTEQGSSYTVMEYIEGVSLDKQLAAGKIFDGDLLAQWYYQLATALEALHKSDVCHRDIKPANIIQMPGGDVCLIDFNSAFVRGNNTRVISRSLGYASPEQFLYFQICEDMYRASMVSERESASYPRHAGIDWKLSDIYSLGATMYHLYTGRRPSADIGCNTLTNGKCGAPIASVIERSMRAEPGERFSSARELRGALRDIMQVSAQ